MNRMLIRALGAAWFLALAWRLAPAAASDPPQWQPMLAKSFKAEAKDIGVTSLAVYRNTGCVFLQVDGKVYCSSAGANKFNQVNETWKQVSDQAQKTSSSKHVFVLTDTCIKESTDGGATWLKTISLPKDFVMSSETWVQYDAANNAVYLMKKGSDLYKLPRGK